MNNVVCKMAGGGRGHTLTCSPNSMLYIAGVTPVFTAIRRTSVMCEMRRNMRRMERRCRVTFEGRCVWWNSMHVIVLLGQNYWQMSHDTMPPEAELWAYYFNCSYVTSASRQRRTKSFKKLQIQTACTSSLNYCLGNSFMALCSQTQHTKNKPRQKRNSLADLKRHFTCFGIEIVVLGNQGSCCIYRAAWNADAV